MDAAAIYARISRDAEGEALGVERQVEDCRALAERLGLRVVQEYIENDTGASSRSRKARPQYQDMLRRVDAGEFPVVLTYSTSRLTRRPRENEDWIERYPRVVVKTVVSGEDDLSTADGRMVARMKASVDAAEAERTAERVTRAKRQTVEAGGYRGGRRPFGYEKDGMTVRPVEAVALARAAEEILAGLSLNEVARRMTAQGLTTTSGKPLDGTNLRRILQRPRNAGLMEAGGQVVGPATWPAIITEDSWRGVSAVLADPRRRTSPGPARRWLGSGLYRCGVCGLGLVSHASPGRRPSYVCRGAKHVARDAGVLDAFVLRIVIERLGAPDLDTLLAPPPPDLTADRTLASSLRAQMDDLAEQCGRQEITPRQMALASKGLRAALEAVEARLAQIHRGGALRALASIPGGGAAFLAAPLDIQRQVVDALTEIVVMPGRRGRPPGWRSGRPYTDLESVQVQWRTAPGDATEALAAAGRGEGRPLPR